MPAIWLVTNKSQPQLLPPTAHKPQTHTEKHNTNRRGQAGNRGHYLDVGMYLRSLRPVPLPLAYQNSNNWHMLSDPNTMYMYVVRLRNLRNACLYYKINGAVWMWTHHTCIHLVTSVQLVYDIGTHQSSNGTVFSSYRSMSCPVGYIQYQSID